MSASARRRVTVRNPRIYSHGAQTRNQEEEALKAAYEKESDMFRGLNGVLDSKMSTLMGIVALLLGAMMVALDLMNGSKNMIVITIAFFTLSIIPYLIGIYPRGNMENWSRPRTLSEFESEVACLRAIYRKKNWMLKVGLWFLLVDVAEMAVTLALLYSN